MGLETDERRVDMAVSAFGLKNGNAISTPVVEGTVGRAEKEILLEPLVRRCCCAAC